MMTPDELREAAAVIIAAADGAEIESRPVDFGRWELNSHPAWNFNTTKYRVKKRPVELCVCWDGDISLAEAVKRRRAIVEPISPRLPWGNAVKFVEAPK